MNFILILVLSAYALILLTSAIGFILTRRNTETNPTLPASIVIAARNEGSVLDRCLNSISAQSGLINGTELLLADDQSSDDTSLRLKKFTERTICETKVLKNETHLGKKRTLTKLIDLAKNEVIVSRDADTYTVSHEWLASMCTLKEKTGADMVIGPIALEDGHGLLWAMQATENNVLAVLTAGSARFNIPFLCSGANLLFTKSAFSKTEGYKSHLHLSSGDDVFFLEDLKKINARIVYSKNPASVVYTYMARTWKELFRQKIRWSSKVKHYPSLLTLFVAMSALLANSFFIYCLITLTAHFAFAGSNGDEMTMITFLFIKTALDLFLLFLASTFIRNRRLWIYSVPVAMAYPFYALAVAVAGSFVKPAWK